MANRVLGGRYTVQDRIGTGGMAIVYRGLDEVLGRTVAIKTMLPQYAADPSFAARFKQEAQAAAALQSPYIVSVYDWGKDGDTYYIVMEYLRGTDLKSGIRRHGALECKKVAQIGSQIAQALSVAHRHEIIHRDIKPQNIMVQPDGNIKVMDFGIARAKNSHLTTDNSVLGTAHYVSPEQTQGKELGPTTDIYSLGIVMYEAATGKVPFQGDDAISVALKQVNEQPEPPSKINANVDPSLEAIILKCMQKDPDDRFQTADELYHVLRDYMAGRVQAVNAATSVLAAAVTTKVDAENKPLNANDPSVTSRTKTRVAARPKPTTTAENAKRQADERNRKAKRRRSFTMIGFLLLIAAIGTAVALYLNGLGATRAVPNLLDKTQQEALATIEESDFFERGEVTEDYSSTVEEGHVISQNPVGGTNAERGTAIDIVVSKGEEPKEEVEVPSLRGLTPAEAQAELEKVGLVAKNGDSVYDNEIEAGNVATQSPDAGTTVKEGDTVTYHLSKGVEMVEIPNVVGSYESTAVAALEEQGFVADTSYSYSNTYDKGIVMEQTRTGKADKGSTIGIVVSSGPESIEVPSVVGQDQATATETLQNAGFTVNVVTTQSDEPAGQVIDQSVYGSIGADADRTITIYVSSGPSSNTNPGGGDNGGDNNGGTGDDANTGDNSGG